MNNFLDRLKKLYEKPVIQVAVQSAVVAIAESIVGKWGFTIVKADNIERNIELQTNGD